jgi:hypothetical protein
LARARVALVQHSNKPVETEGAKKFLSALPRTTLLLSMELGREGGALLSSELTVCELEERGRLFPLINWEKV